MDMDSLSLFGEGDQGGDQGGGQGGDQGMFAQPGMFASRMSPIRAADCTDSSLLEASVVFLSVDGCVDGDGRDERVVELIKAAGASAGSTGSTGQPRPRA